MKTLINSLISLVASVVCLFLAEGLLALLGYPAGPVRPVSHAPNLSELRESIEYRYQFMTNSQGLAYREVPLARTPGTSRVLVLGDSYTEGWGVEMPDRFTNRLERHFADAGQSIEFINGGLAASSPTDYARLLDKVGLKYQPDAVLICVFTNDVYNSSDAENPDQSYAKAPGIKGVIKRTWPRSFTLADGVRQQWAEPQVTRTRDFIRDATTKARRMGFSEAHIQAWRDSLSPEIVAVVNTDRFHVETLAVGLLKPTYWEDSLELPNPKTERKWRNMVKSLDTIVDTATREDMEVALVYLPVHFQYDPGAVSADHVAIQTGTVVHAAWLQGPSEAEGRLQAWAETRQVPFTSLTEAFRAAIPAEEPLDFPLDGHWTAAGHAVAAEAMANWLQADRVFSATSPP
jgi:lysophospholipase L1-like esterase